MDLKKSPQQTRLSELLGLYHEINYFIKKVKKLSRPEKVKKSYLTCNSKCYHKPVPVGPVLIIAPFNYPVQLSLMPYVGCLASGNPCLLVFPLNCPNV